MRLQSSVDTCCSCMLCVCICECVTVDTNLVLHLLPCTHLPAWPVVTQMHASSVVVRLIIVSPFSPKNSPSLSSSSTGRQNVQQNDCESMNISGCYPFWRSSIKKMFNSASVTTERERKRGSASAFYVGGECLCLECQSLRKNALKAVFALCFN